KRKTSDVSRSREKRKPSSNPKVADEKRRSETPFNKRSVRTTLKPNTETRTSPSHHELKVETVIIDAISAANVTKRTRNKLIVRSGVMSELRVYQSNDGLANAATSIIRRFTAA